MVKYEEAPLPTSSPWLQMESGLPSAPAPATIIQSGEVSSTGPVATVQLSDRQGEVMDALLIGQTEALRLIQQQQQQMITMLTLLVDVQVAVTTARQPQAVSEEGTVKQAEPPVITAAGSDSLNDQQQLNRQRGRD